MKNLILIIAFMCSAAVAAEESTKVEIAFSPNNGGTDCTELIVKTIGDAKESILIQAYNFTSEKIGAAIAEASKRGVDVHIILDHVAAHEKGCQDEVCRKAGCNVEYDSKHKIAHNKLIIIDGFVVIGGSFNYSDNAEEHNAENVTIIHNHSLAALYIANWNIHKLHSDPVLKDKK